MRLLIQGSASHLPLADESVQTCVTSPPYWGLRQYAGEQREVWGGDAECAHSWQETQPREAYVSKAKWQHSSDGRGEEQPTEKRLRDPVTREARPEAWGEITNGAWCACGAWYGALGLEPTPELYVEHMVAIFREVRRVLRRDGTLWLNLGDSYAAGKTGRADAGTTGGLGLNGGNKLGSGNPGGGVSRALAPGYKPKDLVGIPWMVAFALRADGWYLRSDIIWHKPNPMPESVTDRPTKAHEYLFLLTKSERYFYDADAIREEQAADSVEAYKRALESPRRPADWKQNKAVEHIGAGPTVSPNAAWSSEEKLERLLSRGRNKRTVWTIPTRPYPGAHFATYPEQLVEPCILAGTSPKACGVCGAPWERVTEREFKPTQNRNDGKRYDPDGVFPEHGWKGSGRTETTTTGWRSTCEHERGEGWYWCETCQIERRIEELTNGCPQCGQTMTPAPAETRSCVVLDPFNGSGTTGRVAIRHGRRYVGVDISSEYLREQATQRIDNIQHVMNLEAAL